MDSPELQKLAKEIESAPAFDGTRLAAAIDMLASRLQTGGGRIEASEIDTTDGVIHLIDRLLPGWAIDIDGVALAPDGHWHCHLRRTRDRDNDEVIGSGKGPVLRLVLLAALLRVLTYRAAHPAD